MTELTSVRSRTLKKINNESVGAEAVAWAESPLQLLSIVEAHAAGVLGNQTTLVPRRGATGLDSTSAALAQMRLPDGLRIAGPRDGIPDHAVVLGAGDSFSGVVQRALVQRTYDRIVLVDDGLATLEMLRLLGRRGAALTRARVRDRSPYGVSRWVLGELAASRLRSSGRQGKLDIVTSMHVPAELRERIVRRGIRLRDHNFPWLRRQPAGPVPSEPTIVLGSSLHYDGLVRRDRYLQWVLGEADRSDIAYIPHRRESDEVLGRIAEHPRARIVCSEVPVELSLRGLRDDQRVTSLPSTVAVSLRLVLEGSGVEVDVAELGDEWWTSTAGRRIRRSLSGAIGNRA